ncbi:MAG TPA: low molecular weight phosphatase family protein [Candidatus Norongarragalinales archaeon]|nr:low molecular weight phosphatase family protein [Candidatus Norongarragalinales archaeon]
MAVSKHRRAFLAGISHKEKRINKKIVLFICISNSGRSQMAEAIYNSRSRRSYAISAGSSPAEKISEGAARALSQLGISAERLHPKKLTQEMVEKADKIVTMGCKEACPQTTKYVVDWGLEDPTLERPESYAIVRDKIVEKVKKLVKEIEG